MVQFATIAVALLAGAGQALSAAVESRPGSLPSRRDMHLRDEGLRLVKTSEDDPGTWMTEEEKFEKLISKKIGFMDITETIELESFGLDSAAKIAAVAYPSGPSHQTEAKALIANAKQSNLETWANGLANIYNRYYRGSYAATSAAWMLSAVQSAASSNSNIKVSQFSHSYSQPSVIAKLPGTSSSVVIVSAHYDSVGSSTSGRAPGADDNASGVVVVLEALRVLAAAGYAPKNTLEFHFYSGEEGGLLGSRDIFNNYASNSVDVLAVVNQDMTGYSPNNVIAVYTDYVNTALTNFVKTLVPVYSSLPLSLDKCGYGCSDHASANSAGFPSAYVCDENMADSSPYIHSSQDTIATLSFPHILEHTKFTIGFLVEGSYF
uniref:Peptide hydrolase n=1 Tax=Bionectria ochroleuca TaxID=29856 RepID=A0A8H7NPD5_BIOOC